MNKSLRYSGIAALSVSLIMLSIGSMPQANAGQVTSSLLIDVSCGLGITDPSIDFDTSVTAGDTLDNEVDSTVASDPSFLNPGSNVATSLIKLQAGDSATGGYAGSVDNITHIPPSQMDFDFIEDHAHTTIPLDDANTLVEIGSLLPGVPKVLHAVIDTTPTNVGGGITDTTWDATIEVIVVCAVT